MSIAIAAFIGVLVGGVLVWLFYARTLERHVKTAVSTNTDLHSKSETLANKIAGLNSEHQRDQSSLAVAEIEISQLQNQLKRESNHAGRLETENDNMRQQLATAVIRIKQLQENLKNTRHQANTLKSEKKEINKQLTLNQIEQARQQQRRVDSQETAVIVHTRGLAYHLQSNHVQLQELKEKVTDIRQYLIETNAIRQRLQQTEDELTATQENLNTTQQELTILYKSADPLREINGIGPVYAERLHEAGIHTIADLAKLTPSMLAEKIGELEFNHSESTESWIAQAKQHLEEDSKNV